MGIFSSILLLFLTILNSSHAQSPLVGRLSGNKLIAIVKNHKTLLELDLQAPISTIKCQPQKFQNFSVKINSTDGANPKGEAKIALVPFKCSTSSSKASLLGTSPKSLPAIFASQRKIRNVFSYCLTGISENSPPSPIFFGVENVAFMPNKRSISSLLQYTPLESGSKMGIRILDASFNSSRLSSIRPFSAVVSTIEPYTKLERPVYDAIRDGFNRLTGIPRASPPSGSPPFETCFLASALGSTRVGPAVPQLDLHLAGNTTWSIFGANSIVVLGNAACVALLPAASGEKSVIGAYTQRDNLIEFDIDRRRFGYTSILYFFQTTCGNFNFTLSSV